jgi:hypothetical protein
MKTNMMRRLIGGITKLTMVGLVALAGAKVNAASETSYLVDINNNVFTLNAAAPGNILAAHPITGLGLSESVLGIDWYAGTVYALGSSSKLYTLDPNTGAATAVGSGFGTVLNGFAFGVDNSGSAFNVVSDLGQSLSVNRTTGVASVLPTLAYVSGDPSFGSAPRIAGLAWDPFASSWYGIDYVKNTLVGLNLTLGTVSTIGGLGIDVSRNNGFEISPATGVVYLGSPAASSDPAANLYTVSKTTGAATLVGLIGQPGDNILVRGLTVVPEPSTLSMLALGGLALGLIRRRK